MYILVLLTMAATSRGDPPLHGRTTRLVLLLIFLLCRPIASTRYFFFCDVRSNPIVRFHYDPLLDVYTEYSLVAEDEDGAQRRHRRNLRVPSIGTSTTTFSTTTRRTKESLSFTQEITVEQEANIVPAFTTSRSSSSSSSLLLFFAQDQRNLDEEHDNDNNRTTTTLEGRICGCADEGLFPQLKFYCPADISHCALSVDPFVPPACMNISNDDVFSRSIFPILLIWYALAFVFCTCTIPGRHAFLHCLGFCSPCWNLRRVMAMIRDHPVQANAWVRHVQMQRPMTMRETYTNIWNGGNIHTLQPHLGVIRQPVVMELKTTKFQAAPDEQRDGEEQQEAEQQEHSDENDSRPACSICMGVLQHDDRVGELECEHVFHVECLKVWLKRRNVCPLCLRTNIAQVRGAPPLAPAVIGRREPSRIGNDDDDDDDDSTESS